MANRARIFCCRSFALALLLVAASACAQPDYAREQRWADEITPRLVVGDAVTLMQKSGHKLLALYAAPAHARGAVMLVHGLGVHPDWGLIGALRTALADAGYATLAVQMPVLAADAKGEDYGALFPDAAERLQLAVAFLQGRGHRNIALASHSMGARMSNYFLVNGGTGVAVWISIGISSGDYAEPGKLKLPVLDIYGERDLPQVLQKGDARTRVLQKLKGSAQIEVAGADHYFAGYEAELGRHLRQFLDRRFN